jgi:hypothetical protein
MTNNEIRTILINRINKPKTATITITVKENLVDEPELDNE